MKLKAETEVLQDAWLLPCAAGDRNRGGVFRADGTVVESAIHRKGRGRAFNFPEFGRPAQADRLESAIFGGFSFSPHFGHQITESIARLWAVPSLPESMPVLFLPAWTHSRAIPDYFRELVAGLGIRSPLNLVQKPTRVKTLYVPSQLFGLGTYLKSHPEFIRFSRALKSMGGPAGQRQERVYVSRSRLPATNGIFAFESRLEDYLRDSGYHVVHPQELSIAEQVALYTSARQILFAEGSAVHLHAIVATLQQNTGVITRRFSATPFVNQFKQFVGGPPGLISCIVGLLAPVGEDWSASRAVSLVDFRQLGRRLNDMGFVEDDSPWPNPSREEILAELHRLAETYDRPLRWISTPEEISQHSEPEPWAECCLPAIRALAG